MLSPFDPRSPLRRYPAAGGGPSYVNASGGVITVLIGTDGKTYRLHTFTDLSATLTVSVGGEVNYAMVGGAGQGGGSANPGAGCGGEGGEVKTGTLELPTGALPVVIGAGGFRDTAGGLAGAAGTATTFQGVTAAGGAQSQASSLFPTGGNGSANQNGAGGTVVTFPDGSVAKLGGGGGAGATSGQALGLGWEGVAGDGGPAFASVDSAGGAPVQNTGSGSGGCGAVNNADGQRAVAGADGVFYVWYEVAA